MPEVATHRWKRGKVASCKPLVSPQTMEGAKDLTSSSFGLVIAYVLPGFAGIYAMSFWLPSLAKSFSVFLTSESSIGLFLCIVLAALALSLLLLPVRWLLLESLLFKLRGQAPISAEDFGKLNDEKKLAAFRVVVDEHYRYSQFWSGSLCVLPAYFVRWLQLDAPSWWKSALIIAFGLGAVILMFLASRDAYLKYVVRTRAIAQ